jgi:tRNA threonylcarbamoyladenosine biosynthesis protein TsaB
LGAAGLKIGDIDCFAAVTGPGSFTGIRVGVCTAAGFNFALNKKIIGVTAFEIILEDDPDGAALIDALHGNFYAGKYTNGKLETAFLENCDPNSINEHPFLSTVGEFGNSYENPGEKLFSLRKPLYAKNCADYNRNFIKVLLKKSLSGDFSESLQPLYLRKSQAERENPDKRQNG